MIRVLASLAMAVPLVAGSLAIAKAQNAQDTQNVQGALKIADVRVGFAGHYKAGLWTPVEVTLRGTPPKGSQLAVIVPDGDGIPSRVHAPLSSQADDPTLLYVRFGRVRCDLVVEVHDDGSLLARRTFRAGTDFPAALPSDRKILLAVGPKPMGIEEAVGVLSQTTRSRMVVVRLPDCRELPTQWHGYEGAEAIFLSTSQPAIYAELGSGDPRLGALDEWVRSGGSLVLCVGGQAEQVLRIGAPLAQFSPGRLERMVSLRTAGSLEAYAGSALSISGQVGRFELDVPLLTDVQGKVEASDGSQPLIIRSARDFGEVVVLTVDPDLAPFDTWTDRGQLMAQLLGKTVATDDEVDESTVLMHFGYTDLAGQLRSALDQFPGVRPVSFWLVVGLIVLYILAIGPGDYFFLRKIARRMELTWITFPLTVLVTVAIAYWLTGRFKSDRVRVNQIQMIDVDTVSGRVRGTTWANLFSPRMDRYDIEFQPSGTEDHEPTAVLTSWLGLSGDALGGMASKTTDSVTWKGQYEFSPHLDALMDVPIPIWSTRSFTARWTARAESYPQANLIEEGQLPVGTITNTLDFPLREALLTYGRWAYPLATIEPGESVELGPMAVRREIKTLLTKRKMVYDDENEQFTQRSTPYDRAGTNPVYVLRAMAFFDAAGGRRYTGLKNGYQEFVDLSHLLQTNRAVLIAQGPENPDMPGFGARLLCNGRPVAADDGQNATVLRFVFPVTIKND